MEFEEPTGRVVIAGVNPEIACGCYPIKRAPGEKVVVEADVFADGHDLLSCVLLYRREADGEWAVSPMTLLGNDRWRGEFPVNELVNYRYTLQAWVDPFLTWRSDMEKRIAAGQVSEVDLLIGAQLIRDATERAQSPEREELRRWARGLTANGIAAGQRRALESRLAELMIRHADRSTATTYRRELAVRVSRREAVFSTWYEMFPRSAADEPGRHGTFRDCEARLPYVAAMGFDVCYLPPIHPIGVTHRKGKNNTPGAGSRDPGSPWAIGSEEGGYTSIHPQLGTLEEFHRLVRRARELGIQIALDIAFQASPDHPYVREHPEWFSRRPDGTIQYAENPPKKYQDIYPFDFETEDWWGLWHELKRVVLFWVEQGVRIFRVDNPHTKPFSFWEWLIAEVKRDYPEVIFLSEAFTRPRIMYHLARIGFDQSYTYFAWRNTKWELEQYFTELTQTEVREYFRPSLWPNTPDILTAQLQQGGRPSFMARLVLAATLGASYGIYGPAFELGEHLPREPGSEEYLNSEKYELRYWDLNRPDSLSEFITRVNGIRRDNPALQSNSGLRFHATDNDQLICYSKSNEELTNIVLTVVNLDHRYTHSGWVTLPLGDWGLRPTEGYRVEDMLSGARYTWRGATNYIELDPHVVPAHIFKLLRQEGPDHGVDGNR